MMFENAKAGDLFISKDGRIVKYSMIYELQHFHGCFIDNLLRVYKPNGNINSFDPEKQGANIKSKLTKQKDPEYFL